MGRMDATLFVHPTQLMAVIQKKDQIDCKFYRAKKDLRWLRPIGPHFSLQKCGMYSTHFFRIYSQFDLFF